MLLKHPELANSYMHHSPVCKRYSSMTRAARIKQEKEFAEGKTEDPYFLDKISASKIVESINVITPPLITIENVADYKGSPEMSKIRRALKKKGYFISEDVIDTKYLGSAQSRKRLIVRASKLSEPEPVEALGYEERADNITGDWYVSLKKQIKREQNKGALSREYLVQLKIYEFDSRLSNVAPETSQTLIVDFIGVIKSMSGDFNTLSVELGSNLSPVGAQVPPRKFTSYLIGSPIRI